MKQVSILAGVVIGLLSAASAHADKTYSCTAVQNKANASVGDRASVSITTETGVCNFSVNGARSTTAANSNSGGTSGNERRRPSDPNVGAAAQFQALRLLLSDPRELFDRATATSVLSDILLAPFMVDGSGSDIGDELQGQISDELLANLPYCVEAMFNGVETLAGGYGGVFCESKADEDGVFELKSAPSIVVEGQGALLAVGVNLDGADYVTFITPEFAAAADVFPSFLQ